VHLMLGISDLLGSHHVHQPADPEDGQHRREDDEGQPRGRIPRRVFPVPVPVLDPHGRRIGSEAADLYGRRRWP
jgi:hypothetical protein